MATISETLLLNGTYPARIDQSINLNSQVATAVYTYSDSSKIYGAYAYNDATAVDYLAAAYGTAAVVIPTPAAGTAPPPPTATPALSSFAVATNGLSITYNISGIVPLTAINGTYAVNGISTPLVLIAAPNPVLIVDSGSGLTTITGSFQTIQIKVGDTITISTITSTPVTTALTAVAVTNNSTYVLPAGAPVVPLSFNKYNLGASSLGGKVTIPAVDMAMAVSTPILVSDFRELQYSYVDAGIDAFAIAFENNSNFTRNISPGTNGSDTPFEIMYSYDTLNISGTTGNTNSSILNTTQASVPYGSIVSVKKAANGLDLVLSKSADGITFTPLVTRVAAFVGITTIYIKVIKVGNFGTGATKLTNVDLALN